MRIVFLLLLGAFNGFSQSESFSNLQKAKDYFRYSLYDSAYLYGKEAFEVAGNNDSLMIRSAIITGLSKIQEKIADSIDYIGIAHRIAQNSNNPIFLAETENAKGKEYYFNTLLGEALPYFLRVDSLSKTYHFLNETTIDALIFRSEISRRAFTHQAVEAANDLMLEALEMSKEIRSEEMEHLIYLYLSDLSGLREKYDDAKKYADLAFEYFNSVQNVRKLSRIYWIYTSYYQVTDQLEQCQETHMERIAYLRKQNDPEELASALVAYGNFFRRSKEDCGEALSLFEEAKVIYNHINDNESDRYLRLIVGMAICYAETGDYKKAYEFYDAAYGLKVETMQKSNQELTRNLETKYQTKKKEREIELLSAKNKIAEQQKNNQLILFTGIFVVLGLVGSFLFYGYRNKLKTANKLRELDELKSRFFANISHEFRTPLTLIKSPLQSVMEEESSQDKIKKLQLINQNADRMLTLVDQLLELSKLDAGSIKLILRKGNIITFINSFIEPYSYEASQRSLLFKSNIKIEPVEVWYDKDVLEKVLGNLLSNALKYTPANESIYINAEMKKGQLIFSVQNTGISLSALEKEKIFERFYQKDDNSPGAGIGLALTKELISLYKGELSVTSDSNSTTFTVTVPTDKELLKDVAIIKEEIQSSETPPLPIRNDEENQLMLVVDDNISIRNILRDLFSGDYKVLEAKSGNEALNIAKREVPDIIISDVMMPGMDGFEFTKTIKEDEITSFIPIILLTAKTGDEAHLQSLQSQADGYLTKPFNNNILKAKVSQLIAERNKLRERYSQELILKPKDIVLSSADEKFIDRLQQIIDIKLVNPDFSVDEFSTSIGMSRMQLHRKLKSLTGLSATEFIRSERLKMAASLLSKGNVTVSEVAYAVGFNDISYFSKCFKEQFATTPTDFLTGK